MNAGKQRQFVPLVIIMIACILIYIALSNCLSFFLCYDAESNNQTDNQTAGTDEAAELLELWAVSYDALNEEIQKLKKENQSLHSSIKSLEEKTNRKLYDIPLSEQLQLYTILKVEQAQVILPELRPEHIFSLMHNESRFQIDVQDNINANGTVDTGLCQINSVNWDRMAEMGIDVHTPTGNIDACIYMLTEWGDEYSMSEIFAIYASGETGYKNGQGLWLYPKLQEIGRSYGWQM